MPKTDKDAPELVRAAQELEDELTRLEALSTAVQRVRLDTEKNITKAAKELGEALKSPERLGAGLGALARAMQEMQVRQQAALEPLAVRAAAIQERGRRLEAHMLAFAALGKSTAEATRLLESESDRSLVLEDVKSKLAEIAENARALFELARTEEFPEVAREADALAKRLGALGRRFQN